MRKLLFSTTTLAAVMAGATLAQAFPAPSAVTLAARGVSEEVIQVRQGCGLGWHRGPWGWCHPNGLPVYRPYAYYGPPPYPRCWWRSTPAGPQRVCAW